MFSEDGSSCFESHDDDGDDDNVSDVSRTLDSHKSHQNDGTTNATKCIAEADHEFV